MDNTNSKIVNIYPKRPITTINPPIRLTTLKVRKSFADIYKCLISRAIVDEVLPDGKTVRLTFENYKSVNIPNGYEVDSKDENNITIYSKEITRDQKVDPDEYTENECAECEFQGSELCADCEYNHSDDLDAYCFNKVDLKPTNDESV